MSIIPEGVVVFATVVLAIWGTIILLNWIWG